MIKNKISHFLSSRQFISVATCDSKCKPNAAPKFILKVQGNFIYLVDYTIGRTWENLKANPYASLSFMDTESLTGYQVNGAVEIIDSGTEYETIVKELLQREVELSTERVIEGIVKGKVHKAFEAGGSKKFTVFKVKMEELVEIDLKGSLKRETL